MSYIIRNELSRIPALSHKGVHHIHKCLGISFGYFVRHIKQHRIIHGTDYLKYLVLGELFSEIKGSTLVKYAQGIPHGAVRQSGHQIKGVILRLYPFFFRIAFKCLCYVSGSYPFEIKSLTSGKYGGRYFLRVRCCQYEYDVFGRFLQRL